MAGQLTTFGEQQLLSVFSGVSPAPPGGFYLALMTSQPGPLGGGTEVSGNGYQRQGLSMGDPSGSSPAQISNTAIVGFPQATAAWGTVTDIAIYDSQSGGNMWAWADLSAAQNVTGAQGSQNFQVPVGAITLSLT